MKTMKTTKKMNVPRGTARRVRRAQAREMVATSVVPPTVAAN